MAERYPYQAGNCGSGTCAAPSCGGVTDSRHAGPARSAFRPEHHPKGWGHEEWVHNGPDYCGKVLVVEPGKRCSLHFHVKKAETFYVLEGAIHLELVDRDGTRYGLKMFPGDAVEVPPGLVHRFHNQELERTARIMEVSTQHFDDDSYRVQKGD